MVRSQVLLEAPPLQITEVIAEVISASKHLAAARLGATQYPGWFSMAPIVLVRSRRASKSRFRRVANPMSVQTVERPQYEV